MKHDVYFIFRELWQDFFICTSVTVACRHFKQNHLETKMPLGTWRRLLLLSMWAIALELLHIQCVTTEVRLPCGTVKDWFPSDVKPQSSKPPYVLDVISPDGKSERYYGPDEELTYTSKILFIKMLDAVLFWFS